MQSRLKLSRITKTYIFFNMFIFNIKGAYALNAQKLSSLLIRPPPRPKLCNINTILITFKNKFVYKVFTSVQHTKAPRRTFIKRLKSMFLIKSSKKKKCTHTGRCILYVKLKSLNRKEKVTASSFLTTTLNIY